MFNVMSRRGLSEVHSCVALSDSVSLMYWLVDEDVNIEGVALFVAPILGKVVNNRFICAF